MKTSMEKVSDAQLLHLLNSDPHEGMVAAVELYTGILWHVAEHHLQNPEDIKECVNDTFMEFYLHRDRFDPEKGTLTTYLSQIVRNLAISRYRKNKTWNAYELPVDVAEPRNLLSQVEDQSDLSEALSALKPENADIIRMKYYEGMTVREIADRLGLSYESVKKRHQRSLGKLKALLLGLLLLALLATLAACAYAALRYFGIVPGYGVSYSPEAQVYILDEQVQVENENGTYIVDDAVLLNGSLYIQLDFCPNNPDFMQAALDDFAGQAFLYETSISLDRGASWIEAASMMNMLDDHWELTLLATVPEELFQLEDTIEAAFRLHDQDFSISLGQVQVHGLSNYVYQMGSWGGLLAIPRMEDSRLIVSIYPLDTGETTILSSLLRGTIMEGKIDDVTATSPDGMELIGEFVTPVATNTTQYFADWDFGSAEPGEYTIHIPYVYLSAPVEETIGITLDLEQKQWEQEEFPVPGGTLSIESCRPLELAVGEAIPGSNGNTVQEDCSYWVLRMRYASTEDLVMTWCSLGVSPEMEMQNKFLGKMDMGGGDISTVTASGFNIGSVELEPEENYVELLLQGYEGCFDPSNVILTVNRPLSLRWDHSFDLPLLVEAETEN